MEKPKIYNKISDRVKNCASGPFFFSVYAKLGEFFVRIAMSSSVCLRLSFFLQFIFSRFSFIFCGRRTMTINKKCAVDRRKREFLISRVNINAKHWFSIVFRSIEAQFQFHFYFLVTLLASAFVDDTPLKPIFFRSFRCVRRLICAIKWMRIAQCKPIK